jgi:serine/threonine protein phosphatase 1
MSRLLAIGDIHGCWTALSTLTQSVPIRDDDLVVTLGDYVDRGPDTRRVLEWVIARYQAGRLIPLRGNHEIMMLEAREGEDMLDYWIKVGGRSVLASYAPPGRPGQLSDIPSEHWIFLERETRRFHETDTHFFVHANVVPDWPLNEQPDEIVFWERCFEPIPHMSGKIMICGHTPQTSMRPANFGHAVCIDTWAYRNGWLTCLDPATGQYWQANQQGDTRRDFLE